jgi:hypothetical protein
MGTLRYVVEVTTERESGLFAGRDEIAEKIEDALNDALQDVDLTGLGSQSNSDYAVTEIGITEVDNKQIRAEWQENQRRMHEELPGDPELRKRVKALTAEVREKVDTIRRLQSDLERSRAERAGEPTRVFVSEGYGGDKVYLRDSVLDRVNFIVDENDHERDIISVTHRGDEGIEVRYENMGRNVLAVLPQSGNVLRLVVVPR